MVLASDIINRQGRMLLPEGSILEKQHLRILRIWGITEADIENVESDEAEASIFLEIDPEVFRQCDAFLNPFFINAGIDHEAMQEIYRVCLLHMARDVVGSDQSPRCVRGSRPNPEQFLPMPRLRTRPSPESMLRKNLPLATFPEIYYRVCEVFNSPHSAARHVAEVISGDPILTARLLRLVNCPLYGLSNKIESVSRAVALFGSSELCTLVLGITTLESFKNVPVETYDMEMFWSHSISTAVIARLLAAHKPELSPERLFVSGLLHDIGLLPLLMVAPNEETLILEYATTMGLPIGLVEQEVLGFDHGQIGAVLLGQWNFPETLVDIVGNLCTPQQAFPNLEPALLHMADILAQCLGICKGHCQPVPILQVGAWEALNLSPQIIAPVMNQAARQVLEIRQIFFSNS